MQTWVDKTDRAVRRIKLSGDIDHHSVEGLRAMLDDLIDAMDEKKLVLEFSRVGFVDSSGVGMLIGRYKKMQLRGAQLCVSAVSPQVDKLFSLCGVYQVIAKEEVSQHLKKGMAKRDGRKK